MNKWRFSGSEHRPERELLGILHPDGIVYPFGTTMHDVWMRFFTGYAPHRLPIAEAIDAYKAIGYRVVRLKVADCIAVEPEEEES